MKKMILIVGAAALVGALVNGLRKLEWEGYFIDDL